MRKDPKGLSRREIEEVMDSICEIANRSPSKAGQIHQLEEECSEFIQAVRKYERAACDGVGEEILEVLGNDVVSEAADVFICAAQIPFITGRPAQFGRELLKKVRRQCSRLDNPTAVSDYWRAYAERRRSGRK